jgi:hypothetical protein
MNNRQESEVRTSFDRNTGANANATMNLKRSWNKIGRLDHHYNLGLQKTIDRMFHGVRRRQSFFSLGRLNSKRNGIETT